MNSALVSLHSGIVDGSFSPELKNMENYIKKFDASRISVLAATGVAHEKVLQTGLEVAHPPDVEPKSEDYLGSTFEDTLR